MYLDLDKLQKAFVDGTGLGWHEHHPSEGGFSRFRRAAETPFNLVFEARI